MLGSVVSPARLHECGEWAYPVSASCGHDGKSFVFFVGCVYLRVTVVASFARVVATPGTGSTV